MLCRICLAILFFPKGTFQSFMRGELGADHPTIHRQQYLLFRTSAIIAGLLWLYGSPGRLEKSESLHSTNVDDLRHSLGIDFREALSARAPCSSSNPSCKQASRSALAIFQHLPTVRSTSSMTLLVRSVQYEASTFSSRQRAGRRPHIR